MNPVKLVRIAAEAELLRLRAMASRQVRRVVLALVGAIFLLAVLIFVHILVWHALAVSAGLTFYAATCLVGGVDLLVALVLLAAAASSRPNSLEHEALDVRRNAVVQMRRVGTLSQLALPTLRLATRVTRRRRR